MTKLKKPPAERWTVARAKERFSELLRASHSSPQAIYRRGELVAYVVDAEMHARLAEAERVTSRRTLAEALAELRGLLASEGHEWPVIERTTRTEIFSEALDEPSR